jgi:Thioredoxin
MAQNAVLAKPVSLPDMALGSAKASVTIVEYASMSCPHCAAFEQNVFSDAAIDTSTLERCVSCLGNFRSTSGRGGLDAGAVHRRRRRGEIFQGRRAPV